MTGTNWPSASLLIVCVCCVVVRVFASTVQCLERHRVPGPLGVLWGVCGVCCFVVFVGGFSGGVTPGPFPNPEAKPACADGTAPGRVWESRSLPASFFVVEGVWVRGLVDCPVWMVGRFLCLCTLCFLCVVFTHNSPQGAGVARWPLHRYRRGGYRTGQARDE